METNTPPNPPLPISTNSSPLTRLASYLVPKSTAQWLLVLASIIAFLSLYESFQRSLGGYVSYRDSYFNWGPLVVAAILVLLAADIRASKKFEVYKHLELAKASEIDRDKTNRRLLEEELNQRRRAKSYIFALIVPVWLVMAYQALYYYEFSDFIFEIVRAIGRFEEDFSPQISTWVVAVIVLLLTITLCSALFFMVLDPIRNLQRRIKEADAEIEFQETQNDDGRHNYLRRKLQKLTTQSAQVFLDSASDERQKQVAKWREEATKFLETNDEHTISNLNNAQFMITSIEELILREETELAGQRHWQYFAIGVVAAYFITLIFVISWSTTVALPNTLPVLDIPPSIVVWGALGGLAAVLYRFYTEHDRVRFEAEIRWLIARPLIGIIMGAITYLAVATGLILFGVDSTQTADNRIYWIVAFLAGFSDKFYLAVINLVVGKFVIEEKKVQEVSVTKTTATVQEQASATTA